jgi:hypothetical protein
MELTKGAKWYKTTGGKIGIAVGIAALVTGIVIAVKKYASVAAIPSEKKLNEAVDKIKEVIADMPDDDMPKGVCGSIQKSFDRVFDYVKCDGVWWTISKDKIKIPEWKSLADNPTATKLLNNKYPN